MLFIIFVISSIFGYSQEQPIFNNSQVLVAGTNLQPGAVYLVQDVVLSGGQSVDA